MKSMWLVVGVMLLAACGGDGGGARADTDTDANAPRSAPPRPVAQANDDDVAPITCSTFYRSSVTKPVQDGPVLTFDKPRQSETAKFDELVFRGVHLNDEFDARSLNVSVSEPGRKHPLFHQLFQMERNAAPENIFGSTGQGFTGLLYAYSAAGAELQFFCKSG